MKVIVLIAGARAGLEFFQSLLDGHKEILQLPGYIHINKKLQFICFVNNDSNFVTEYKKFYNFNYVNIN